jgi:hypothetical protein
MRLFLFALCAVLFLSSCGGGTPPVDNGKPFQIKSLGFSKANPQSGDAETLTIRFEGGTGPYNFTVTMDDAVTPATATASAVAGGTSISVPFTFDTFTRFQYPSGRSVAISVSGTDSTGASSGPVVGNLTVFSNT